MDDKDTKNINIVGLHTIGKAFLSVGALAIAAWMGHNGVEYHGWVIFLAFVPWIF